MPRSTFEALTLGTLAVIVIVGIAGYVAGARVRADGADVPMAEPV